MAVFCFLSIIFDGSVKGRASLVVYSPSDWTFLQRFLTKIIGLGSKVGTDNILMQTIPISGCNLQELLPFDLFAPSMLFKADLFSYPVPHYQLIIKLKCRTVNP